MNELRANYYPNQNPVNFGKKSSRALSSANGCKSKTSLFRLTTGIDLPTADGKLENPIHGLAIDPFVFDVPGGIRTGDEIAPTVRISNEDPSPLAGVLYKVFRIHPSLLNSSSC
jgi:hypothetical protein